MRERCENVRCSDFRYYGGRGIRVVPEWADFAVFLRDVGRRPSRAHTLDRIDNDGNYEPGNVRWATRREQARNTRTNHWIEYAGERRCLADWAERIGVHHKKLSRWVNRLGVDAAMAALTRKAA